jgi:hypothetical protein
MVASTAVSAVSSISRGNAEKRLAYSQASSDEEQGRNELMSASERAQRIRMQGQRFLAEQRLQYASSGVEGGSGSALEVGSADAAEIELDALTELYGGQSRNAALRKQAELTRKSGKAAQTAGYIGAASSVLKTASSWASLGGGGGGDKLGSTGGHTSGRQSGGTSNTRRT